MVVIYYRDNGDISTLYSGDTSQIGWYLSMYKDMRGKIDEVILEDDVNVLNNPFNYKVKIENGEFKDLVKKTKVHLSQVDNSLVIELSNIDDTDNVDEIKIPILFGDQKLELSSGTYEIDMKSTKPILIMVDSDEFISEPLLWEV